MVFESMTICLGLTCLFMYYSTRYGLGKDVPVDPAGKAHVWANEVLGVLKDNLANATINDLQPGSVAFVNGENRGKISCTDGKCTLEYEGQKAQVLNHQDEAMNLKFEKLSEQGLFAKLEVKVPPDGVHDVGLRVDVVFSQS